MEREGRGRSRDGTKKKKPNKLLLSSVHNKVNSHNITMGGHLTTICSPYYHYNTCHNFYSTVQFYSCELASSPTFR